ncbi:MAG: hypothetical protein MUF31_06780 [Akkermansiaceae bacterium]|jgi:hypothetical protein|nr:hypothetical protein [Akkermansiaceae bacterium]
MFFARPGFQDRLIIPALVLVPLLLPWAIAQEVRSELDEKDKEQCLYRDLDGDGDPDLIERWWSGKRIRWIDENDDATASDRMPDMLGDCLQVDGGGDGHYDGPSDITVKWSDCDGDGIPDIELYNENPSAAQKGPFSGSSHFFVSLDPDGGGRFSGFDWQKLKVGFTDFQGNVNWTPNYHGNALFLKEHMPAWAIREPERSWENPFLFWDPDGDGCSEISMRVTDTRRFTDDAQSTVSFDGVADEVWVSWDVDNDAARDQEKDYDLTLYLGGGEGLDYKKHAQEFKGVEVPAWGERFFVRPEWRKNRTFQYLPHDSAFESVAPVKWEKAYLTFDEDDDCHRWERVELYYPGEAYLPAGEGKRHVTWHPQADSLGDRGEWDEDFSGGGKIYLAPWDGRWHLLGAESGVWLDDPGRRYWGAAHPNRLSSRERAPAVGHVVLYKDADGNGFFDLIQHDFDGDRTIDLELDLKGLGVDDRCRVIDPLEVGWEGLGKEFIAMNQESWKKAAELGRMAFRAGWLDADEMRLMNATGIHEKYENAQRIRLGVIKSLMKDLPKEEWKELQKAYLRNDLAGWMEGWAKRR